jgi:hypothetical protein
MEDRVFLSFGIIQDLVVAIFSANLISYFCIASDDSGKNDPIFNEKAEIEICPRLKKYGQIYRI